MTSDEVRDALSARQVAVLKLVSQGLRQEQVADKLHISPKTVHKHLVNIRERLNATTTAAAAVMAAKAGLV